MGLLEDAIREHLELKRRRGADPEEIRRLEAEAFGPVRRDEPLAPQPDAHAGAVAHGAADVGLEQPGEAYASLDTGDAERPAVDHYAEPPVQRHEEPAAPADLGARQHADEPPVPPADEPLHPSPDPHVHPGEHAVPDPHDVTPPHGDPLAHQPTREFTREELQEAMGGAHDPQPEQPSEPADVLEETPDFLQDTPEHDRLWFEQKPPRDFDF